VAQQYQLNSIPKLTAYDAEGQLMDTSISAFAFVQQLADAAP